MNYQSSLDELKGIGEKTLKLFQKIGVYSFQDILLHFPRKFIQFPEPLPISFAQTDETIAIRAKIAGRPFLKKTRSMDIVTVSAFDESGTLDCIWFRQAYLSSVLSQKQEFIFYGKAKLRGDRLHMENPKVYTLEEYQLLMTSLQPVYELTKGLSNKTVTKTLIRVMDGNYLPPSLILPEYEDKYKFPSMRTAFEHMHFPMTLKEFDQARKRFVYEEFFSFLLCMKVEKNATEKKNNENLIQAEERSFERRIRNSLSYELTTAQERALSQIYLDVSGPYSMHRLIQGDVGSGKTIVAFLAMSWFCEQGMQSVLMAPTEVLATQHFQSLCELIEKAGLEDKITPILLTGSMKASEKKAAYQQIASKPGAIIIGTHALIQDKVNYHKLGLVITDEQHRFGVRQRDALYEKGREPHILVMSATPIPRTLAIILYGDLDVSVMDELPAHRIPIKNCVVGKDWRPNAYKHIAGQIAQGHQAYVICPLVDESEDLDAENVIDYTKKLREALGPKVRVEYLHGRMKGKQKDQIMEAFSRQEIDLLVSTTVIEVGINVPNATVMMIENADRFGLAQLHQLRGRVGRGQAQSYCIFLNTSEEEAAYERLKVLNESNDGFEIAARDLELRGPGDYFGIRQSGELSFRLADIYQDQEILKMAEQDVQDLLSKDPNLSSSEHVDLREYLTHLEQKLSL